MRPMRRILLTLCLLAAASPAAAQSLEDYDYENLAFRGLGVGAGYLWSDRVEETRIYSVRLDLGYVGPGLRIIPSISYWSSRFTIEELDRLATRINQQSGLFFNGSDLAPLEWSDISLDLDAHFVWNTPLRVLTYLGAGVGLHALNGNGRAIDDTFVEDLLDAITAGAAAIAGFEFEPINRLRLFAEGRYTALNSIQYMTARGGLQFMFPSNPTTVGSVAPVPGTGGGAR